MLRAWARSYDRGYIVAVVVSWVIACRGRVVAVQVWPCVCQAVAVVGALWRRGVAAVAMAPGRRLGRGGRVAFLCRRRVVATRRTIGVILRFLCGVVYLDLHSAQSAGKVIAIKQTTTERNGDEREATTTKPTAARTVTRSPLGRRGMDD